MKKILIILFSVAVAVSCGRSKQSAGDNHAGHDHSRTTEAHVHGEGCDHDHEGHDHEKGTAHVHADGTVCTGDHGHEGHDHAAEAHVHGEDCDHDHDSEKGTAHVHADGTVCTGDHDHEGHDHAAHAGHDHSGHSHGNDPHAGHDHGSENPDEIVFTAAQAAKTDFRVEKTNLSTFTEVIKTSGRVMPAQGQEVTLVAPVSGIVSFAGANLAEGRQVGSGGNLFYVSSKNVGGGDTAVKAIAAYQRAKAEYERAQGLVKDRIVSQREFEAITAEYLQAKAEFDAVAGAQSERGTRVASPISGYVTTLAVGEGDFVEVGQTLATVSQNRRLVLRAEVSQRYYGKLGSVKSANFTVPYDDRTYSLADMGGRLLSVGQSALAATSLIPVTFEFDNNGSVVPGSYVEVYLQGAPVANAVTLPVTAITEQQGLYYVYVQIDAECYERREVALGGSDGQRVRILKGVKAGERVVTRGAVNVKLASASGSIPHTHEH